MEYTGKSIKNISALDFPFKSHARTMVDRASAVFGTPTSWPESFILDTGRLLEQYDLTKVVLLRNNALFNIAESLDKSGIKKALTRLVLTDGIHQEFKTRSDKSNLATMIPWLKGEVEFIESLDLNSIVNTFKNHNFSNVTFSTTEKHMIANKIEQFMKTNDFGNDTDAYLLGFSDILEGFSRDFLQSLPDELIQNFTRTAPFQEISKARLMVRRLKQYLEKEFLSAKEVGTLFNGLNISDVKSLSNTELEDMLPMLRNMDLPFHLGNIIVKKLGRSLLKENKTGCNMAFTKLGKLAAHLNPRVLEEEKYIPVNIEENFMEDCPQIDIELKKSQAIAVIDNVREMLMNMSGENVFNANILHRLGCFSEGLSVKDIEALPFDTEMLSIIEVMGNFEDDLSSAQVEAITNKIRKYFDISNRNEITEASDITVAQIGRFLQYLHPKFELLKFPKAVRPSISREIGRSSLLKVSNSQRQELLLFALKNSPTTNSSTTDLLLKPIIRNEDIEDLGSLRCGLTVGVVKKLSDEAISANMEDINNCPMKEEIFEALVKRAVDLNINRLKSREGLGSIGSMLQYVREVDSHFINKREMSSIASYLATTMDQLDSVFKKSVKNGFVLENNSRIKGMHKQRHKNLANTLYTAMIETQKKEDCTTLLMMGPVLPDVTHSINTDVKDCLEAVGTLPNWDKADARTMLEKTMDKLGKPIDEETLRGLDQDMIIQISGLLKSLTAEEIRHLNLNDINSLALLGSQEFSNEQLHLGFENWKSHQTINAAIEEEELLFMQNFGCGMSPSVIENSISGSTVRNCLESLGQRRCFKQNQTEALAKKLVQSMQTTPISEWKDHVILDMRHLIGGLQKNMFQDLTKNQVQVIEPEVITALLPEKVQDFTVEQLQALSPNQAAAFTTMQRSFMTEEQMAAIGKDVMNGVSQTTMTNTTIVIVLLSIMRQLVVHL